MRAGVTIPTIQHATTRDGARVAFHRLGEGPAVVLLFPYHVNHLTLNWLVPLHRGAFESLARHFTVVNLDHRGAGCSACRLDGLSLAALTADIEAVLAGLHIESAAVCAMGAASLVACHFASTRPATVSRVVLLQGGESEANRRLLGLRHEAPGVEAQSRGALLGGLDDRSNASALAAVARASLTPDCLAMWEKILERRELLATASRVRPPVLCLHAADDPLVTGAAARDLAGCFTDARLLTVPGRSGMDIWRHRPAVHEMTRFIAEGFGVNDDVLHATAAGQRASRAGGRPAGLSGREVEVLRRVAAGMTNRRIAEELFISMHTVSYHLRSIFAKTRTDNRTEAAAFAHRHGLVPGEDR
jgi:DNA-binding CsgD family transcriptional regulator/pimeloyl-ACP methyl ester carboxylesterase